MTNKNPSPDLIDAIRFALICDYTGGYYYLWSLTGRSQVKRRQQIMSLLLGTKMPQSKCGINALLKELYAQCGVTGTCGADRDKNFIIYARGVLGNPEIMEGAGR